MKNLNLLVRAMREQTLEEVYDHKHPKCSCQKQRLMSEALRLSKLEIKINNYVKQQNQKHP